MRQKVSHSFVPSLAPDPGDATARFEHQQMISRSSLQPELRFVFVFGKHAPVPLPM